MKNIYCRGSRISSWCLRLLIERYVAGDTALEAKQFIEGVPKTDDQGNLEDADGNTNWVHEPHLEPSDTSTEEDFNTVLLTLHMPCEAIVDYANKMAEKNPSSWKKIKISRVTVNRYFLLLGKYCWEKLVAPTYYKVASKKLEVLRPDLKNIYLEPLDNLTENLVRRSIKESIKWANGTLLAEKATLVRKMKMMPYLEERSTKFNGLKLKYGREHVAWATLAEEAEDLGLKRTYMASQLARGILNEPLKT